MKTKIPKTKKKFKRNKNIGANSWEKEWVNMPEYNNVPQPEPFMTVTFKFRSLEDFKKFNTVIKKTLYNGEKVFDGRQRKTIKSAWYPSLEKAKNFIYI